MFKSLVSIQQNQNPFSTSTMSRVFDGTLSGTRRRAARLSCAASWLRVLLQAATFPARDDPYRHRILITLLFCDIVGSTERAAELGDRTWSHLLRRFHASTARCLRQHRGTLIDTAGDGLFARFDGPACAVHCGLELIESVGCALGIRLRVGVHVGECELLARRFSGIAVNTCARVASVAGPGQLLVTSAVKDLSRGSGLRFQCRGRHFLRGVPQPWLLYGLEPRTELLHGGTVPPRGGLSVATRPTGVCQP